MKCHVILVKVEAFVAEAALKAHHSEAERTEPMTFSWFPDNGFAVVKACCNTSRACPFVVGQEWSSWTSEDVKACLVDTAKLGLELPFFSAPAFLRTRKDAR